MSRFESEYDPMQEANPVSTDGWRECEWCLQKAPDVQVVEYVTNVDDEDEPTKQMQVCGECKHNIQQGRTNLKIFII